MIVALFACMTGSAFAVDISKDKVSGYLVGYKLSYGDSVYKGCLSLGINFNENQDYITKINNITNYGNLAVGRVVWLPVSSVGSATMYYTLKTHVIESGDTLEALCTAHGIKTNDKMLNTLNSNLSKLIVGQSIIFPIYHGPSGTSAETIGKPPASGTASESGGSSEAPSVSTGDPIAYYLYPYVMQQYDMVINVCADLGINFNQESEFIRRVNNISSWSNIPVGAVILLPVKSAPSKGYTVYAHKIVSGDMVVNICSNYGIAYSANEALLKAVNNSSNLGRIYIGDTFYVPVSGVAGGGSGGSGGGSGSATTYDITKVAPTNGTYSVKVGDVAVKAVAEGKTVSVVATPNSGYTVDKITVTKTGDTSVTVAVTDGAFKMPAFPVTVTVTFKTASAPVSYNIYSDTAANGTYKVMVNGTAGSKAKAGDSVKIVATPNDGYKLESIKVTYNSYTNNVDVDGDTFTMIDHDVRVTVSFVSDTVSAITLRSDNGNGTFYATLNGSKVTEAPKNKTVSIYVNPDLNYELKSIEVYNSGDYSDKAATSYSNGAYTFTMPGHPVTIKAEFQTAQEYTITTDTGIAHGSISAAAKAKTGEDVYVTVTPDAAYTLDKITVTDAATETKSVPVDNENKFVMPSYNVKITASFVKDYYAINKDGLVNGDVKIEVGGEEVTKAMGDDTVTLTPAPATGYKVKEVVVSYNNGKNTVTTTQSGNTYTFKMPNNAVDVSVVFTEGNYGITYGTYTNGKVTGAAAGAFGSEVELTVEPDPGYTLASLKVVDKADESVEFTVTDNKFTMPAAAVKVIATFKQANYTVYNIAGENGTFTFAVGSKTGLDKASAKMGETVTINAVPAEGYVVGSVKVYHSGTVIVTHTQVNATTYTFTMPAHSVKVEIEFVKAP